MTLPKAPSEDLFSHGMFVWDWLCIYKHNFMLNTNKWNKSGDYFTLVILRYIIQMTMLNNFDMDIIDHVELIIST